ncbi:hypothetical protein BS47DRAFT_1367444 [Hydnum rufescens UP504]|uniref:Uncharacterized protein n=1 Tax=Hydnum rufescens UP504 TaxID=1448309 RepID=A0A9P6DQ70_9AGAM|nr:hypothetical protein BS47DRAFT_1367444 [Hydnum rufescens UP504]
MLVIYRGHQARDGATYPPGRGCVALLDPFSSAKPQPNYPQMRPRVKYGGARSHPGLQPSCILNPHNDESSTALHTRQSSLGPFSLRETDLKNAQTTSTTKYGSTQPPKTPTHTLYDNETSTVPHTRFGGDLHYMIPDPTNAQARLRAKHGSAQPPRPPDPQVLSPSTKPNKAEIWARAQPLKTPTSDSPRSIWIKHGATHPLWRVPSLPHAKARLTGTRPTPSTTFHAQPKP